MKKWKDILGFEGYYQVSNIGDVRSLDRVIKHSLGGNRIKKGQLMSQKTDAKGYKRIKLFKDGQPKHLQVHRLVAQAFIPNPLNLPEVNHKFGIKADNRVSELEWITRLENQRHAFRTKLVVMKKGKDHHFTGKTEMDCHNSKKVKSTITGEILNQGMAAKKLNLSAAGFSLMLSGKLKNRTEYTRV